MTPRKTNVRKFRKRLLWLSHGLFYVALFLIVALGLLHTPWAKNQIEALLEDSLSQDGTVAEVQGLGGLIPLGMTLERFSLADTEGVWFEVDGAKFDVSVINLFRFALRFQAVGAERIAVWRIPEPTEPPPPPSNEPFALPDLPDLPKSLPDLAMRKLYANHVILGEPILGRQIDLSFLGKAATQSDGASIALDIDIQGREQTELTGRLTSLMSLAEPDLNVELAIEETGGLVADLAGMPEIENVRIRLDGSGPLADWQSDIQARIEGIAEAQMALGLGLGERKAIYLNGHVEPDGQLLPEQVAALLTSPIDFDLEMLQNAPGKFSLSKLHLQSDPASIEGTAKIDQATGDLAADILIRAADLSRFEGLAGQPLAGSFEARLIGGNEEPHPALELRVDGDDLRFAEQTVEHLDGLFDFAFLAPLDQGFVGSTITGGIEVNGIASAGQPVLPDQPLRLDVDAELRPTETTTLNQVRLDAGAATLEIGGKLQLDEGSADLNLRGDVPSLPALLASVNQDLPDLEGAARLTGGVAIKRQFQEIAAVVELQTSNLVGLPGGTDTLVGTAPNALLRAEVELGSNAKISDLIVRTDLATLNGTADIGLDEAGIVSGRFDVDLPSLAGLEETFGQPIEGTGRIRADIRGTIAEPGTEIDIEFGDLQIAGQTVRRISLLADADQLSNASQGDFRLEIEQTEGILSLASRFSLIDQFVELSGIALDGPQTRLTGDIGGSLETMIATGRLSGGVADLSALRPWHGQNLEGSVDIDVALDNEGDTQNIVAEIGIPALDGDFGSVQEMALEARATDLQANAEIAADLTMGLFEQPGLLVRDTAMSAQGRLDDLTLQVQAAGQQADQPFNIAAAAQADIVSPVKTVLLKSLRGRAAGQDIVLEQPANIRLEGDAINVDRLDLSIEDARIEGRLDMRNGRIDGRLDLNALPLAMLNAFGAPNIAGDATASATISGPTSAPTVEVGLAAAGIRPNDQAFRPEDGLDLDVAANIAGGKAQLKAEIANLADRPAVIDLSLPMRLAMQPFVFELSNREPLQGSVEGTIDLARIVRVLQLDGQVVEGLLTSDLTIGGNLQSPQILGETRLNDGLVEDSATGLSLKFMRGALIAEREELRLESFETRDGDGGKLRASGNVDIRPGRDLPFAIQVTSEDMRVLSNELGRVYVDTDVAIDGNAKAGAVNGTVTLTRAEIAIPSGGGIDPVALDVEGVGANKPAEKEETPEVDDQGPGYLVDLNLLIDIPSKLFVRGRGLDTEWGGQLDVSGTSASPVVKGGIEYRRGFLDFLDRRFDIAEGLISFTGASPPIPEISLRAEAQGPSLLAVVTISGPATAPDLELSSEPARPNDEVLADLLFNRDVSAITPVQAIRLANAVRTLEGGGIDTMGSVRDAIGVDTLDIGGDSPEEASAKVGKYVADGVFLELERGLSSGTSTARVEVELTDNISVNTEVSDDSQAGVGLEWSLDY